MATEPSTVIRIAIAYAALKHKPREQSTTSYVLDLQSRFPLSSQPISSQTQDNAKKWRAHALHLESQLKETKARQDADQQELVQLRHDVAQAQAQIQGKESSSQPPKKKAKKKHKQQDPSDSTWKWDLVRTGWSDFIHSLYPPGPSLLISYNCLRGALLSSFSASSSEAHKEGRMETYVCRLADAMIRAIEAIYAFLFVKGGDNPIIAATSSPIVGSLPSQMSSPRLPPHSTTVLSTPSPSLGGRYENLTCASIAMCYPLLAYTLTAAFPALLKACEDLSSLDANDSVRSLLVSSEQPSSRDLSGYHQLNRVIDVLLELILLPFVRALRPLCWARLLPIIEGADAAVNAGANTKNKPGVKAKGGCEPAANVAGKEQGKAKEKQAKGKPKEDATKTKAGKGKANQKAKDREVPARDADLTGHSIPAPSDSHSHPAPPNVCADVLALLGMAARALESLSSSTAQTSALSIACGMSSGVRERLGLEAIRELEALYDIPASGASSSLDYTLSQANQSRPSHTANAATCSPATPASTHNTTTHTFSARESTATHNASNAKNPNVTLQAAIHEAKEAHRENLFRTLATKDAAWYLCSVLHIALLPPTDSVTLGDAPVPGNTPVAGSASLRADGHPRTLGSASPPPSLALLTRATVTGIGRLLRFVAPADDVRDAADNCHGSGTSALVDPVTQNILLAICEQALKGCAETDGELPE
ncbi:hypothetical protein EDD16DRAFT_1519036 [Pisolithus croceorrhizus]|nr:hypothetical protein EDD16DRAFT_1519036 [Pisolithus croceorrhizus]